MWHDDQSAAKYVSEKANRPVSARTVQKWRLEGHLAWRRIGKTPRIMQDDLDAFLERDIRPAKPPATQTA